MDALTIKRLLAGLGSTHANLLAEGVITSKPLAPSLEGHDNEYLIQKPESGVELWFRAENRVLTEVLFSLINMAGGIPSYTGELPSPLTIKMSRIDVHRLFGAPFESKEPVKILKYRGYGGSDIYRMDGFGCPGVHLGFQYRNDDMVCSMGFCLRSIHHN
jgi:hypothetical protein